MVIQLNLSLVADESIAISNKLHWRQIIAMQTSVSGRIGKCEKPKANSQNVKSIYELKFVSGVQAGNVWSTKRSRFKAGSGLMREREQKEERTSKAWNARNLDLLGMVLLSVPSLYKQLPLCWCTFHVHFKVLVLLVQVEFVSSISDDPSTIFEWMGELLVQASTMKPVL